MASDATQVDPCLHAAGDLDERALAGRRRALLEAGCEVDGWSGSGIAGLALSGGGIRSATLSLGLLQAVARHGLLGHFDYVSTVSGGGYIGAFLRSLFLPQAQRGPQWRDPAGALPPGIEAQHRYAMNVLTSPAADREVDGPEPGQRLRNPIWWLRRHSRYLAPNGPSDYAVAASYLARNWLAMLYVFTIAVAGLFTLATLLLAGVVRLLSAGRPVARLTTWRITPAPPCAASPCPPVAETVVHFSPWLLLAAFGVLAALACGLAYWMTENMRSNPQPLGSAERNDEGDSRRRFLSVAISTAAVAVLVGAAMILWDVSAWHRSGGGLPLPARRTAGAPAIWIVAGGAAFVVAGVVVALIAYLRSFAQFPNPTVEMRRLLTGWLTTANLIVLVLAAAGLCDSLALVLRAQLPAAVEGGVGPLLSTALIPVAAFAINRSTGVFAGKAKGGGMTGFVVRHAAVAMLLAGVLLYGAVAILVDAAVQALLWRGDAWGPAGLDHCATVALAVVLAVLIGLTGRARGFINLSSLHQLYAARLTRAYLGATNLARLQPGEGTHSIKESDAADHIEPRAFYTVATTAPIPLTLTTLNETIAPQSQLTERDRKGVPLLLGPHGISVDRGPPIGWRRLAAAGAEALSMGQWCAISGAAASSGMGRLTTLGGALTLTFANVRLGYWWDHGDTIGKAAGGRETGNAAVRWLGRRFDTFVYLFDEMTARYSRNWRRVYLSDGGHFENSGAYALLHRRAGVILLNDGGADPEYRFDDLEQLVRKVRLDLRGEVEPVDAAEAAMLAGGAARLFLNARAGEDWHDRLADPAAFALLLRVRFAGEARTSMIVWLKPRPIPTMAADVAAYARASPEFPHQPTGDQFFDEAQWESYRKLGLQMTDLLLRAAGPGFLDRLRAASGR